MAETETETERVKALKRRADEEALDLHDVRVGDGQALPWDDETFDGAFSMAGLIFFPDHDAGFRELLRVLRPGRVAVVSSNAELPPPFLAVLEAISSLLPDLPLSDGKMPLADAADFTAEMSAAGFGDVRIDTVHQTVVSASVDAFWDKAQRSAAPLVMLKARLGDERWADLSAEVLARLREQHGGGTVDELYVAHLGTGSK